MGGGVNATYTLDVASGPSVLWMFSPQPLRRLPFAEQGCDMRSQMSLPVTLAFCAAFLAVAILAGWRGAQPPNPHRGPRMIPWRPIMVAATVGLIVFLVHAVNLLGVTTGH
jgi:hypothetical protein